MTFKNHKVQKHEDTFLKTQTQTVPTSRRCENLSKTHDIILPFAQYRLPNMSRRDTENIHLYSISISPRDNN